MDVSVCIEGVLLEMEATLVHLRTAAPTASGEEIQALGRSADVLVQSALTMEEYLPNGHSLVALCTEVRDTVLYQQEGQHESSSHRGRPRIMISEEQLLFYVENGFKVCDIAALFGCSRRTVERRMQEFGVTRENRYTTITDGDLVQKIGGILAHQPNSGEKTVDGILRSQGIFIQRARIRESMHAVDPEGVQLRHALHYLTCKS